MAIERTCGNCANWNQITKRCNAPLQHVTDEIGSEHTIVLDIRTDSDQQCLVSINDIVAFITRTDLIVQPTQNGETKDL